MLLFLGTAVWEGFPGAATRVLLPLNLAFNVVVHRTRASLAWLLLGNLTVLAGLLALRDVPRDPTEVVAQRLGPTTAIVRFGPDWFGREHDRKHVWLWARERGTLALETRPATTAPLRLEFALRSLAPRTVILRRDGHEVWRAEIGTALSRHSIPFPAGTAAISTLEFSTPTPGTPESAAPGARELAFALYDPRVALAQP